MYKYIYLLPFTIVKFKWDYVSNINIPNEHYLENID